MKRGGEISKIPPMINFCFLPNWREGEVRRDELL
jgi:hypothetical protein